MSISTFGGRRARGIFLRRSVDLPTVSVVTAAFNSQQYISDCIDSVALQDYANVEHIIVDAASTDGTVDILRRRDSEIDHWISEPDGGIFDAWNKGLNLAGGTWIAFLGSDDTYLPGAVGKYMRLALENPHAEFLASRAQLIHPSGYSPIFGTEWRWPACARQLTTINVGTMHHRNLFDRYGNFDATYRSAADYEFLLRAGKDLRTAFTPEVTVKMRAGGASESTANLYERRRAKIRRGVRSDCAASTDLAIDIAKFHVRRAMINLWAMLPGPWRPNHQ
jgi:glycosyltransferase involved in cell wall biosynthesis